MHQGRQEGRPQGVQETGEHKGSVLLASAMELYGHLHLPAGSVTPLGLLNDETRSVVLYLDEDFREGEGIVGVHPNDNTATVWLHWRDLTDLLASQGCAIHMCHMPREG